MAAAIATPFDSLIEKLIGSQTTTNTDEQLGVKNLISQMLSGTQQTTGTDTSRSVMSADLSRLADVYNRQAAGITPEMLQGIFREGAKAVPQLVSSTANAVGARSGGNSALATSLGELNTNLVGQAAKLNMDMLGQAGQTAAQIGALTRQVSDTKNTGTNVINNQATNTNQDQVSTKASDSTVRSTINTKSSAITAGIAGIASILQGMGIDAGTIKQMIGGLLGGGAAGQITNSYGTPLDPGVAENPFNTPVFDDTGATFSPSSPDWYTGWADGGIVPTPQLAFDSKKALGQR